MGVFIVITKQADMGKPGILSILSLVCVTTLVINLSIRQRNYRAEEHAEHHYLEHDKPVAKHYTPPYYQSIPIINPQWVGDTSDTRTDIYRHPENSFYSKILIKRLLRKK